MPLVASVLLPKLFRQGHRNIDHVYGFARVNTAAHSIVAAEIHLVFALVTATFWQIVRLLTREPNLQCRTVVNLSSVKRVAWRPAGPTRDLPALGPPALSILLRSRFHPVAYKLWCLASGLAWKNVHKVCRSGTVAGQSNAASACSPVSSVLRACGRPSAANFTLLSDNL